MIGIKGIVVCVNYDDLLAITLHRNARHLTEVVVVTTPEDIRTQQVVAKVPNARCFFTDAFTRFGAKFNKGLAMNEGFEELGRDGWICIFDADTLFPDKMELDSCTMGKLYGPRRRILADPKQWREDLNWESLPISNDRAWPGYFQLFYASDPTIRELPWYAEEFNHAGGGDGYFENRWDLSNKVRLPFYVLHLGKRDANWFGRATERIDGEVIEGQEANRQKMLDYLDYKGWGSGQRLRPR